MRVSELFSKTTKQAPKDETSVNARLLLQGGFVDKLMAGSYTLAPLGFRVVSKIEQIIREEMDATGAQEILMPLMHPKSVWNETGRWESAKEIMYQFKKDDREYALSFTHEEILLDLVRKHVSTYRDFPIKLYHFSTKFRNELRAKSGLLRGREFLMKDLYSVHTSEEDLNKYYFEVADSYFKVFKRLGLEAKIVEAAGGVFTKENTHEFQVFSEAGEDTIYWCNACDFAENKEIAKVMAGDSCPKCKKGKISEDKSIEVGNIFRFGTVYSEKMNVSFTDKAGKRQFAYLGSYGIGVTRLVGILVEMFHDEKGIVWPKSVAPFKAHLVQIGEDESMVKDFFEVCEKNGLGKEDILWDDRTDVSAGEKFADADLIGIPVRLVVSEKAGKGNVEFKLRDSDKSEIMDFDAALKKLSS